MYNAERETYYNFHAYYEDKMTEHFHLNKGYLSRTVKKLEQEGYILRTKFETDGRSAELSLTEAGLKTICQPNDASDHSIPDMIAHLTDRQVQDLVQYMAGIETLLSDGGNNA